MEYNILLIEDDENSAILIKEFLDDLNKNLNQNIQKEVLTVKTGAFSNEKKELMVIYNPNSLFQNIKANFENKIYKIKMEIERWVKDLKFLKMN